MGVDKYKKVYICCKTNIKPFVEKQLKKKYTTIELCQDVKTASVVVVIGEATREMSTTTLEAKNLHIPILHMDPQHLSEKTKKDIICGKDKDESITRYTTKRNGREHDI